MEGKKPYVVDGERISHDEYVKIRYEDLRIRVPKGRKEVIQTAADTTGQSINGFVATAIEERLERISERR